MPEKPRRSTSSKGRRRRGAGKIQGQGNQSTRSPNDKDDVSTPFESASKKTVTKSVGQVEVASKGGDQLSAISKQEDKTGAEPKSEKGANRPSTNEDKEKESTVTALAKFWRQGLAGLASIIEGLIVSTLLGFNPWPDSSPLTALISQRPIVALITGSTLVVLTFASLLVLLQPKPTIGGKTWYALQWFISTAMPIIGYVLFATVLSVVLIRPSWCPTLLCPAPQFMPITNPQGVHDGNLEVYSTTIQSTAYVLTDKPESYSLSNLPTRISAVRQDKQTSYRVVVGIHDLQQGHYGIIIEEVALFIKQILLIPHPLNVWIHDSGLDYHNNPYQVIYRGQSVGTTLAAAYVPIPNGHVQLAPGEADELTLQVVSRTIANIQFQIQITYRISDESQLHTLLLSNVFEVAFSDISNWHSYRLQNGHLVSDK